MNDIKRLELLFFEVLSSLNYKERHLHSGFDGCFTCITGESDDSGDYEIY